MLLRRGKPHLKLPEKEEEEELEMFQVAGRGPAVQRHEESSGPMTRFRRIGRGMGRLREVSDDDTTTTELEFELSCKVINLEALQQIACCGHLDGESRATVWKLLLGYLPAERDAWEGELANNRLRYAELKEELLVNPSEFLRKEDETFSVSKQGRIMGVDGLLSRQKVFNGDHPLSLGNDSIWYRYFKDAEIVGQIDRDLERTHPDIEFFSGDISQSKRNRGAMRNILLLFTKLNPAIGYVQGMNEVLAPLYYVLNTDPNEQNAVNPQFYAFRWITLLLTQEFEFHCIMRIWDCLLSNPLGVQEMLLRVCCAMLVCARHELLKGDFTSNLKLLQHYPEIDLDYLLDTAHHLTPIS
ncbi:TBC domain-containing protein C1952.17c-like isoform X4 [Phoenix dactylifera]|uniref:TBC domain-containing protein C1952.17c-like isoform X4 n=1 Tax=Phoenix dactylifera TaxID=42345 RepID=A0A8B7C569_PHODC|nr:TBC domain-containing protein C1952.17c-like isoform X4 [Phoenix dactylifera]